MPPTAKNLPLNRPCPCFSARTYGECCAPYHRGELEAADAETMMRSRYSSFAVGDVEYLWRTMHPQHADRKRPRADVLRELRDASASFRYMGLTVLDRRPADAAGVARVLFVAKLFERGTDRSFVELSEFLHDGEGWRYVTGHTVPARALRAQLASLTIDTFAP